MLNYKLSDNQKHNAIWNLLNVNYTEENNWLIEYDICEVYEEYAVVRNYADNCWERVFYTKDDATDSLEITKRERCYIMDVSETEKNALDALQAMNGNTYEKVDENYSAKIAAVEEANGKVEELNTQIGELNTKVEELNVQIGDLNTSLENKNSEFSTKIEELNTTISTLSTERDDATAQLSEAQGTLSSLNEEVITLKSFKAGVEKKEKEDIVSKYSELLDSEILDAYSAKLDEYTAINLDKELAYELVSNKPTVFSKNPQFAYVPKDNTQTGGLEEILSKYNKN